MYLVCCVLELGCGLARGGTRVPAEANVVVQQHSHKLLNMGILMPETC